MLWLRTLHLGVKSLLLHPMRSLLTVLGIFIGVASVIWLLAIGEGIAREAQKQIEGLGADNIIVRSVKPPSEATAAMRGPINYGLKRAEYDKLVETIPTIVEHIPIREVRRTISYGKQSQDGRLVGCTPEYRDFTKLEIERGRFIEDTDIKHANNNCVLAARLAQALFTYEDPIGRQVYLIEHKDFYTVIGVLKHRNATAAIGGSLAAQEFSADCYIPITTLRQRVGDTVVTRRSGSFEGEVVELNQVTLKVKGGAEKVRDTAKLVRQTLGLPAEEENGPAKASSDQQQTPPDSNASSAASVAVAAAAAPKRYDLAVVVPEELLEQARIQRIMFMVLMGMIAAISLLVGGIGIMNIMLATVTERTREIGIRRALGARRSDIIRQFLMETVALSVVGGASGVLFGLLCPVMVTLLREVLSSTAPRLMAQLPDAARAVVPVIVPISIPLAFGISVLVGVVFGIYPAIRAAAMDPIEALRHE